MNGRVYDPELGRFLSADPHVQAPYNSQSYNRYSYVFNNPLSFTDPTGYDTESGCIPGTDRGECVKPPEPPKKPEEIIVTHCRFCDLVQNELQANLRSQDSHFGMISGIFAPYLVDSNMQDADLYLTTYFPNLESSLGALQEGNEKSTTQLKSELKAAGHEKAAGAVDGVLLVGAVLVGAKKASRSLDRYDGPKPKYHINPAHLPGQPGFRSNKTPLPKDAEETFKKAVPNDPKDPTAWFGKNSEGQIYRYSLGNDGTAHFSGIKDVGDGVRNFTKYAEQRLNGL